MIISANWGSIHFASRPALHPNPAEFRTHFDQHVSRSMERLPDNPNQQGEAKMNAAPILSTIIIAFVAIHGASNSHAAQFKWQAVTADTPIVLLESPPSISTNFTCDSKSHSCSCQGSTDCYDLGNSDLCKQGTLKPDDSKVDTLVCEFKF